MSNDSIVRAIEKHKWDGNHSAVFDDILNDEIDKKTDHYINLKNQFEKEYDWNFKSTNSLTRYRRAKHIDTLANAIRREYINIQDLLEKRTANPKRKKSTFFGGKLQRKFFEVRRDVLKPPGKRWSRKNYTYDKNFNLRRYT
tara:strand:- start:210 stop:635 length:426 start_codon:yes stop_codon:yes gene_type:complete